MAEGTSGVGLESESNPRGETIVTVEPPRFAEATPLAESGETGARDLLNLSKIPRLLEYFKKNPEMVAILTAAALGIMSSLGQLGPEWGTVAITVGGAAVGAARGTTLGEKVIGAIGGTGAGMGAGQVIDVGVALAASADHAPAIKTGAGFIDDAILAVPGAVAVSKGLGEKLQRKASQVASKTRDNARISQIKGFLNRVK